MPGTAVHTQDKVIVIPRQLEGFFYDRLRDRYAAQPGVRVVVDRRKGERRRERWVAGPGPLTDRRHSDRRDRAVAWSLPEMPFSVS